MTLSFGNHMISSAIWNKLAKKIKFSKTNKICNLRSLKNLQVLIYSKLHEKNDVITY